MLVGEGKRPDGSVYLRPRLLLVRQGGRKDELRTKGGRESLRVYRVLET